MFTILIWRVITVLYDPDSFEDVNNSRLSSLYFIFLTNALYFIKEVQKTLNPRPHYPFVIMIVITYLYNLMIIINHNVVEVCNNYKESALLHLMIHNLDQHSPSLVGPWLHQIPSFPVSTSPSGCLLSIMHISLSPHTIKRHCETRQRNVGLSYSSYHSKSNQSKRIATKSLTYNGKQYSCHFKLLCCIKWVVIPISFPLILIQVLGVRFSILFLTDIYVTIIYIHNNM